jgi:Outer membrane protein beta-barrel domain
MKKFFVFGFVLLLTYTAFAQKDTSAAKAPASATGTAAKKDWSKISLKNRANDHFMVQVGYDNWAGAPDSVSITGFGRSFNFYAMYDMPFKTDPRFSVAAGLGIGCSNVYFNQQQVLVAAQTPTLQFQSTAGQNHFKKFKLVATYLDIPIELRFALDPENTNKSWKFAIGTKVGFLLSTYTKGKNLLNNANQSINNYIEKESSKAYFNGTRLAPTIRISKGPVGVYAQYQVTSFTKTATASAMFPWEAGIVISGL